MATNLFWANLTIPPARNVNGAATGAEKRQLVVAGSRNVVPLVYGEDRYGARILNVLKAADNTDVLVQALWGFSGDSVNDVRLNDLALASGASITHYTGTQTTADSTLVAAFAAQSITYTDTLAGRMYSVMRLPSAQFNGSLKLTARVRGRKLYDPRKDSTNGGTGSHRLNDESTWEWSQNPALALADWLRSTVYGAGEAVIWSSVAAAANACDANVGSPAEARRRIGISFVEPTPAPAIRDAMRAYAGCFLLPEESGIRLVPDADGSTVATFNHASGDIARIEPLALRDLSDSPTVVRVWFTNTTQIPWFDDWAEASLPGVGTTLPYRVSEVRLPGVQRYSQAYREAVERLNKLTLQDLSFSMEAFDKAIGLQVADLVEVTHPIGLSSKKCRVTGIDMPGPGRWRLQLLEHDPASYSSRVVTQPTYSNSGLVISDAAGAGGDGISSYMIEIYRSSATVPPTPQGGNYTFVGDVLVPPQISAGDAQWADVLLRLDTQGTAGATSLTDQGPASLGSISFSSGASIATTRGKWSSKSLCITEASPPSAGVSSSLLSRPSGTAMTLETWFFGATIPNRDPSVCLFEWRSPTGAMVLRIYYYANLGRIYVNNGGSITDMGLISLSAWHWLQAVVGTDDQLRIRIDNTEVYSAAFGNANASGSYTLRVGATNGTAADAADVSLDDIRVTKGVRAWAVPTARLPIGGPEAWGTRDMVPTVAGQAVYRSQYLAQTTTPDVPVVVPFTPGAVVTWAAGDFTTPTISESGRRAVIDAGAGGGTGIRTLGASVSRNAGKRYFEITYISSGTYGDGVRDEYGLARTGAVGGQNPATYGIGYRRSGNIRMGGSVVKAASALSGGDIIGVAVDFSTRKVWMSLNGTWLQGDPAAGTSQLGILAAGYGYEPAISSESGSGADVRLSAKSSDFAYAAPAGFASWGDADVSGWSAPVKHVQDGVGGESGVVVFAYQRSASGAPALPTADVTYTFSTKTLTGLNNGWSATIPSGTGPLYITAATARSATDTDTIVSSEWAAAQLFAASGLNSAPVLLYKRTTTSTAPATVSAAVTYTFATGVASGLTNGWTQELPTTGGGWRWVINATALSAGATDTLPPSEFSAVALLSEDGVDGSDAYALRLTNDNVTVPADSTGFVTSYSAAQTTGSVIKGGTVDDTANWTITKSDGPNITSTRAGTSIQVTSLTADVGAITVTAERAGFVTLVSKFTVSRARSAATLGGVLSGATYESSDVQAAVGTKHAAIGLLANGRVTSRGTEIGNWYAPTTAGVGSGYWVRAIARSGSTSLTSGAVGTWVQLTSGIEWVLDSTSDTVAFNATLDCAIAASSGGTVLGTFVVSLTAGGYDPFSGGGE